MRGAEEVRGGKGGGIVQVFATPLQGGLLGVKKKCMGKVHKFDISF